MVQSRQRIFQLTYGFRCSCISCRYLADRIEVLSSPQSSYNFEILTDGIRRLVGIEERICSRLQSYPQNDIPSSLLPVFHETFIMGLSTTFSNASHEGQYHIAIESGKTLLAIYVSVYPENYPQIGMLLLELAKTAWNKVTSSNKLPQETELATKKQAKIFLSRAREVLSIFGQEGDKNGPLQEIEFLQALLT